MAAAGIAVLYRAHVRPWMFHWGARDDEISARLPGDELIEPWTPRTTRAVTIDAQPRDIWPWLAQIGEEAHQMVASVEAESHLVLVSPTDYERLQRHEKASGCWSFVLHRDGEWTRLLARSSGDAIGHFWFDIPHFVMEQKMLRGIAERSQRSRRQELADSIARHPSSLQSRRALKVAQGT